MNYFKKLRIERLASCYDDMDAAGWKDSSSSKRAGGHNGIKYYFVPRDETGFNNKLGFGRPKKIDIPVVGHVLNRLKKEKKKGHYFCRAKECRYDSFVVETGAIFVKTMNQFN